MARLKFWGWGYEGQGPNAEQQERMAQSLSTRLGVPELTIVPPPSVEELNLRKPRVSAPSSLAGIFSSDSYDRAAHTYGKGFRDLVRAFRRHYPNPPDLVAF